MSQINDALRRAGSKSASAGPPMPPPMPVSTPPPPPPPAAALPPLPLPLPSFGEQDEGEEAPRKSSGLQIILAVVLVVCVSIAAVFTFLEKRNRTTTNTRPTSEVGAKKTLSAEVLQKSQAARQSAPAVPTNAGAPNVPTPARAAALVVSAAPVTPPRPVEPVKFPPLRLQSIFFRPSSPSVMINNKTLFVDDIIQGVQVADIQPSSVTLVLSGQTNILTLR